MYVINVYLKNVTMHEFKLVSLYVGGCGGLLEKLNTFFQSLCVSVVFYVCTWFWIVYVT